ncbi:flagellar biosynthetic protein FliO [Buchnera aphidicola]|uniref:flagellar biosynthetic protein FliO n=1 Tax=Buchnera aphidicola TaxID=9 RepID=UPI0030EF42BA
MSIFSKKFDFLNTNNLNMKFFNMENMHHYFKIIINYINLNYFKLIIIFFMVVLAFIQIKFFIFMKRNTMIKMKSQICLDKKNNIFVIDIKNVTLVLGVSSKNIVCLHKFSKKQKNLE